MCSLLVLVLDCQSVDTTKGFIVRTPLSCSRLTSLGTRTSILLELELPFSFTLRLDVESGEEDCSRCRDRIIVGEWDEEVKNSWNI